MLSPHTIPGIACFHRRPVLTISGIMDHKFRLKYNSPVVWVFHISKSNGPRREMRRAEDLFDCQAETIARVSRLPSHTTEVLQVATNNWKKEIGA